MILSWILYSTMVSAFLAAAALALERLLRLRGRPGRWAWLAAASGSVVWPVVAWLWPGTSAAAPGSNEVAAVDGAIAVGMGIGGAGGMNTGAVGGTTAAEVGMGGVARVIRETASIVAEMSAGLGWLDGPFVALWAAVSLVLIIRLLASVRVLALARTWESEVVDGVPVHVSGAIGPAVTGLVRRVIILPRWALGLEGSARSLLLAHEREHQRSGDGWLILLSRILPAFVPWNAVLWWQTRRLRLAVETDCDARVLNEGADAGAYGAMLLEVARRASGVRPVAAAFLVEPRSFLERRIRTMTKTVPKRVWGRSLVYGGIIVAALAVACDAPQPETGVETLLEPDVASENLENTPLLYVDNERVGHLSRELLNNLKVESRGRFALAADRSAAVNGPGDISVSFDVRGADGSVAERLINRVLHAFDPRGIDRIEIVLGQEAAKRYGPDAMAGVVRVSTRQDSDGASSGRPVYELIRSYPVHRATMFDNPPSDKSTEPYSATVTGDGDTEGWNRIRLVMNIDEVLDPTDRPDLEVQFGRSEESR